MPDNMADELLDLVNNEDKIIGKVWKSEANSNPKIIHREVAIIIYNKNNKILFQKRSKKKKVNPGIWAETTAGHVGKGENPDVAAHRELVEEMAFDTDLSFLTKTLAKAPNETHFTYWYTGQFPDGAKIVLQEDEVEESRFLSKKELDDLLASGEIYDPIKTGGQPKDVLLEFWEKLLYV